MLPKPARLPAVAGALRRRVRAAPRAPAAGRRSRHFSVNSHSHSVLRVCLLRPELFGDAFAQLLALPLLPPQPVLLGQLEQPGGAVTSLGARRFPQYCRRLLVSTSGGMDWRRNAVPRSALVCTHGGWFRTFVLGGTLCAAVLRFGQWRSNNGSPPAALQRLRSTQFHPTGLVP